MAKQYGGLLEDDEAQNLIDQIGRRLVERSPAGQSEYKFEFHVLADPRQVNAFALPGGQVFITAALLHRLRTRGEIAGVLAHEIGHVVARHGAQQLASAQLTRGLTSAAIIANPEYNTAAMASLIGQVVNLKYGRGDELESDRLGVQFTVDADYDPRALLGVMQVLQEEADNGPAPPEFFSTHPTSARRIQEIQAAIARVLPRNGSSAELTP